MTIVHSRGTLNPIERRPPPPPRPHRLRINNLARVRVTAPPSVSVIKEEHAADGRASAPPCSAIAGAVLLCGELDVIDQDFDDIPLFDLCSEVRTFGRGLGRSAAHRAGPHSS